MIKIFLTYLLFTSSILSVSQSSTKRGKITVRKDFIIDTVIEYKKTLDSVTLSINHIENRNFTPSYYKNIDGLYDVWFGRSKIYLLNKDFKTSIPSIQAGKPLKKIKNKARKNKLHYFELKYSINTIDSITNNHFSIHKETKILKSNNKKIILIDSNFKKEVNTNTKRLNQLSLLPLQQHFFDTLTSSNSYNDMLFSFIVQNDLKWIMSSSKTIYKDSYKIEFNLNELNKNQLTIIRNDNERYICDYTIKNRYIYIENPPVAELNKGKFNTKKTQLKFKIHNTKHEFILNK